VLWKWGEIYLPAQNAVYGVYVDTLGQKVGLQDGDKIYAVNGEVLDRFEQLSTDIILNEAKTIQVVRNNDSISLTVPTGTIRSLIRRKGVPLAYPKYPAIVDSVGAEAKILSGTLKKDDQIIGLNNVPIRSYRELQEKKLKMKNAEVTLTVLRGADTAQVRVKLDDKAQIHFIPRTSDKLLKYATRNYTFLESLPAGVAKGWEMLVMNVQNFKLLFTSKEVKASESLGSFLSIGDMFDAGWDWQLFWRMTALLSVVLAFMNMLPIPALDGGHVLFTLYEIITGRKPGDKFMEYAQMVGMILLLGIMAYALGLDAWRFLFKN
jgi:regulator of sigma E protease